jgi:hypothetical protein
METGLAFGERERKARGGSEKQAKKKRMKTHENLNEEREEAQGLTKMQGNVVTEAEWRSSYNVVALREATAKFVKWHDNWADQRAAWKHYYHQERWYMRQPEYWADVCQSNEDCKDVPWWSTGDDFIDRAIWRAIKFAVVFWLLGAAVIAVSTLRFL